MTLPTLDDRFVRTLPGDADRSNRPRPVRGACWSHVDPARASAPRLVAHAHEVAALLGLDDDDVSSERFVDAMAGNRLLDGSVPYAMCYGGHQFGTWAGQLGDGRAINLGEVVGTDGEHWTLQLKGAGPTPYSRMADGYAVLRSSLREFVCSEAMHDLDVPTTRALCLVTTGDDIVRDMFYDGRPRPEPGAITCRVARSFVRFGSFQMLAAQRDEAGLAALRDLVHATIRWHFPHLGDPATDERDVVLRWFDEVARRTIGMVVGWMRVGFVHGVMNTDNMSILGETIDYGPYGWLDDYDPDWTPNTTDAAGKRYRFGHQPPIAQWNLAQLASALVPLVGDVEPLQDTLNRYPRTFAETWGAMMRDKLGLAEARDGDDDLVGAWAEILRATETDMTLAYRALARPLDDEALGTLLDEAYYTPDDVTPTLRERTVAWLRRYRERLAAEGSEQADRAARMNTVNPYIVPRNYLAQLAIDDAERGDFERLHELLDACRRPYEAREDAAHLATKRPDWARTRPGCSMLSCSS